MQINNPYIDLKRDLILKLDQERDPIKIKQLQAEYQEAEIKSREYNHGVLNNLIRSFDIQSDKKQFIKKELIINPRRQYKEAISLYRETLKLIQEIRDLKKQCREDLNLNRKKNEIQKTKIDKWLK